VNDTAKAADSAPASPPRHWRWLRAAIPFLAPGIFGAWLIGELLTDRFDYLVVLFHVPAMAYGGALLAIAVPIWLCRRRWSAVLAALLALGPLLFVFAIENQWTRPPAPEHNGPTLRLVNWNVREGTHGYTAVAERLKAFEADIVILNEIGDPTELARLVRRLGDGLDVVHAERTAVIARGALTALRRLPTTRGRVYALQWDSPIGPLAMFAVHLHSSMILSQRASLGKLNQYIAERRPDVVGGDFNAPRRSPALLDLPAGYRHAYHLAGAGRSYTWPAWCPLLAIDHCLVNEARIRAISYNIESTTLSDHRIQVLNFAMNREEAPGQRP